ncbi:MBOAT, membrane-bound O-acyltransferase family-domain-containing protein [Annulohypoxylon truncatum]|uniref:MBOAT, membrane-bound O-acyltransferase family-domain-containing protein n=1 Tax=Annulohypoxylon truncatum TaxID=327061 RepID=UPI0020089A5C|nr:MBOAT, membrane-bound O-acyltransferase family-domain-containing protein [Annulohypoxylon truncatum]KAI1212890.1 MBOAT, membrane-bound O-acyltransferase family-domain-containing protein [Annulohypoxylon truncatum]
MDSATATSVETDTGTAALRRVGAVNGTNGKAANSDEQTNGEKKTFTFKKYRHVTAVHSESRPSTLSHDARATPSFLGFRNLMVIVLVVGNLRLVIENMQKYGNLICITCHDFRRKDVILGFLLYILVPCHLFIAYSFEWYAAKQARISRAQSISKGGSTSPTEDQQAKFESKWRSIRTAHLFNATLALAVHSWVVYFHIFHPLIGTITELHVIIVYMKVVSYALTNRDLRHAYLHPVKGELALLPELYAQCPYPQNITMTNLIYFWWAPTLVYQPVYPRTDNIRWIFVLKRLGEVVCLSVFIWFCSAQYAAPVLWNSLDKINHLDLISIVERLLKLSTISLIIWLAGFFALFQSALNALAEVMRFGDRSFYDDWWNSAGLGDYWRLWNKPVYQFMKRHIFSPLIGRGWNMRLASIAVFFVSAVLHELLVGIPTKNIIGVAFMGMLVQIPLIWVTRIFERMQGPNGRLIGNCIFWVSFTVLGQPFAALVYFYAWQAKYGSVAKKMASNQPSVALG